MTTEAHVFPGLVEALAPDGDTFSFSLPDDGCSGGSAFDLEALLADAHCALQRQRDVLRAWRGFTRASCLSMQVRAQARSSARLREHLAAWSCLILQRQQARIAACVVGEGCYVQPLRSRTLAVWTRHVQIRVWERLCACKAGVCLLRWTLAGWSQAVGRIVVIRRYATVRTAQFRQRLLVEWAVCAKHTARIRKTVQLRVSAYAMNVLTELIQTWSGFAQRVAAQRIRHRCLLERYSAQKSLEISWRSWRNWCEISQARRRRCRILVEARTRQTMLKAFQSWHGRNYCMDCEAFKDRIHHNIMLTAFQVWQASNVSVAADYTIQPYIPECYFVDMQKEKSEVVEYPLVHHIAREADSQSLLHSPVIVASSCIMQASSLQILEESDDVNMFVDANILRDSHESSSVGDHSCPWLNGLPSPARSRRSSRGPTPSPLNQSLDGNTSRAWSHARDEAFAAQQKALATALTERCTSVLCDAPHIRSETSTSSGQDNAEGKSAEPRLTKASATVPCRTANRLADSCSSRDIAEARYILKERQKVATHSLLKAAIDVLSDDHEQHKIIDNMQGMKLVVRSWFNLAQLANWETNNLQCRSLKRCMFAHWWQHMSNAKRVLSTFVEIVGMTVFALPMMQLRVHRVKQHLNERCWFRQNSRVRVVWVAWIHLWRLQQDHARFHALRFCWHTWTDAITPRVLEISMREQRLRKTISLNLKSLVFKKWRYHTQHSAGTMQSCIASVGRARSPEAKLSLRRSSRRCEADASGQSNDVVERFQKLHALARSRSPPSMEMLRIHWNRRYVHERLHRIDNLAVVAGAVGAHLRRCCKAVLHNWQFIRRLHRFSCKARQQRSAWATHIFFAAWKHVYREIAMVIAERRVVAKRANLRMTIGSWETFCAARRKRAFEVHLSAEVVAMKRRLHCRNVIRTWKSQICIRSLHTCKAEFAAKRISEKRVRKAFRFLHEVHLRRKASETTTRSRLQQISWRAFSTWHRLCISAKRCACMAVTIAQKLISGAQRIILQEWAAFCNMRQQRRTIADSLSRKRVANQRSTTISNWQALVTRRHQLKMIEQELLDRSTHDTQRKCYWIWQKLVRHRKHCDDAAKQILLVASHRVCTTTLIAWCYICSLQRRSKEAIARGAQHLIRNCAAVAFRSWTSFSACRKNCKNAGTVVASDLTERRRRETFDAWISSHTLQVIHAKAFLVIADRRNSCIMGRTLLGWCSFASRQARAKTSARSMAIVFHRDYVWDLFLVWKSLFILLRRHRGLAEARISKLAKSLTSSMFLIWRSNLCARLTQRASLRAVIVAWSSLRILRRLTSYGASLLTNLRRQQALNRWSSFSRIHRVLAHLFCKHSQLRRQMAMCTWRSQALKKRSRRIQADVATKLLADLRRRRLMRYLQDVRQHRYVAERSSRRRALKICSGAFSAWSGFSLTQQQCARLAVAFKENVTSKIMSSILKSWNAVSSTKKQFRAFANSLLLHLIAKRRSKTIARWREAFAIQYELKSMEQQLRNRNIIDMQRKYYRVWQQIVTRHKHLKSMEQQLRNRNIAGMQHMYFRVWQQIVACHKHLKSMEQQLRDRNITGMQHMYFRVWQQIVTRHKHLKSMEQHLRDRSVAGIQHMYYRVWQQIVTRHKHLKSMEQQLRDRDIIGMQRKYYRVWQQIVTRHKHRNEVEKQTLAVIDKYSEGLVQQSLIEWSNFASRQIQARLCALVISSSLHQQWKSDALFSWKSFLTLGCKQRDFVEMCLKRIGHDLNRDVFAIWILILGERAFLRWAMEAWSQFRIFKHLCINVAGSILRLRRRHALNCFRSFSKLHIAHRSVLSACSEHSQSIRRKAVRTWRSQTSAKQSRMSSAQIVTHSIANSRIKTVLHTWQEFCLKSKRCAHATSTINHMRALGMLRTVSIEWSFLCTRRRQHRIAAKSVDGQMCAKKRVATISKWLESTTIHCHLKTSERELCRRVAYSFKRRCIAMWREFSTYRTHCNEAARHTSWVVTRRLFTDALNVWSCVCSLQRLSKEADVRGTQYLIRTCVEYAFRAWNFFTSYRAKCRNARRQIELRFVERLHRRTLNHWISSRVILFCHRNAFQLTKHKHHTQTIHRGFHEWLRLVCTRKQRRVPAMAMLSLVHQQLKSDSLLLWRSLLALSRTQNAFVEAHFTRCSFMLKGGVLSAWRSTLHEKLFYSKQLRVILLAWSQHRRFKQMSLDAVGSIIRLRRRRALHCLRGLARSQLALRMVDLASSEHLLMRQNHQRCLAMHAWHDFLARVECQRKTTAACKAFMALRQKKKRLIQWVAWTESSRCRRSIQTRASLEKARKDSSQQLCIFCGWLCFLKDSRQKRLAIAHRQATLLQYSFCSWRYVHRLQRRRIHVRNRIVLRHLSAWAAASQGLQHIHSFEQQALLNVKQFAWLWLQDSFWTPAVISTWRDILRAAQQQRAHMAFVFRMNRQELQVAFKSWLKVTDVIRTGHQASVAASRGHQCRTITSWWQSFVAQHRFLNVAQIDAERFLIVLWRIGTWLALQGRALMKLATIAWKDALQDRCRFMNELHHFHWCCTQSTIFAAKVAARDVLDVLDAWYVHVVTVVATRRRYAFGIRQACYRPLRLAFRALSMWRTWRSQLPSLTLLSQSVADVVDIELWAALRQWRFQGFRLRRSRCECERLLHRTWTAWQARIKLCSQLRRGACKLALVCLRFGLNDLHWRALQLTRANAEATAFLRRSTMARYFKSWRLRGTKPLTIPSQVIDVPLKVHDRAHYVETGFNAWRLFSFPVRHAQRTRSHWALQYWSGAAAAKRKYVRRSNLAVYFALRQQLRKIWRHWLCVYLQGSPRDIKGNGCSWSIAQMADMVPAGRHLDRLSLWAVVAQERCKNSSSKQDWIRCGRPSASGQSSDREIKRLRLRGATTDKENQPPLPRGADS